MCPELKDLRDRIAAQLTDHSAWLTHNFRCSRSREPIICSPYAEPDSHWYYDRETGIPVKEPGRRDAGYWFKTERAGSVQRSLLTEEERDDLPLVNELRDDVRRWRKAGWPNVSQVTRRLLRHWWREDRSRRLFFCQLEAVETIIYLRELLARGRTPRWRPKLTLQEFALLCDGHNPRPETWTAKVAQPPKLADFPHQPGALPIVPLRLQDGDRQRQDRGHGDDHRLGVLQSRRDSGRPALSPACAGGVPQSDHQGTPARIASRRGRQLLRSSSTSCRPYYVPSSPRARCW